MHRFYYTYILASQRDRTLYIGVTPDPIKQLYEDKLDLPDGCTREPVMHNLVYFERHEGMKQAIRWQNRLKQWPLKWKLALIEIDNAEWRDLYPEISGSVGIE